VDWDSITYKHDEDLMEACDGLASRLEEGVWQTMRCLGTEAEVRNSDCIRKMLQEQAQKRQDDPEPVFFYHSDHLGSTTHLTDDSGRVTQTAFSTTGRGTTGRRSGADGSRRTR